ncbi:hypothetical protein VKU95_004491 [Escherichia coli]|nr:hypothetical protein [Escherichia coli]
MSIKNDGHYFCRAGGNRPDGLNEPVTINGHELSLGTTGDQFYKADGDMNMKGKKILEN